MEQKEGQLDTARSNLKLIKADAKAWRLLLETLRDAEREAKETFLGPVGEGLQPHLRLLFPETKLQLSDDNLEIVSLQRSRVEEPFHTLGMDAREQIAVLIRWHWLNCCGRRADRWCQSWMTHWSTAMTDASGEWNWH